MLMCATLLCVSKAVIDLFSTMKSTCQWGHLTLFPLVSIIEIAFLYVRHGALNVYLIRYTPYLNILFLFMNTFTYSMSHYNTVWILCNCRYFRFFYDIFRKAAI